MKAPKKPVVWYPVHWQLAIPLTCLLLFCFATGVAGKFGYDLGVLATLIGTVILVALIMGVEDLTLGKFSRRGLKAFNRLCEPLTAQIMASISRAFQSLSSTIKGIGK